MSVALPSATSGAAAPSRTCPNRSRNRVSLRCGPAALLDATQVTTPRGVATPTPRSAAWTPAPLQLRQASSSCRARPATHVLAVACLRHPLPLGRLLTSKARKSLRYTVGSRGHRSSALTCPSKNPLQMFSKEVQGLGNDELLLRPATDRTMPSATMSYCHELIWSYQYETLGIPSGCTTHFVRESLGQLDQSTTYQR